MIYNYLIKGAGQGGGGGGGGGLSLSSASFNLLRSSVSKKRNTQVRLQEDIYTQYRLNSVWEILVFIFIVNVYKCINRNIFGEFSEQHTFINELLLPLFQIFDGPMKPLNLARCSLQLRMEFIMSLVVTGGLQCLLKVLDLN